MLNQTPLTININNNYTINCYEQQKNGLISNLNVKNKDNIPKFQAKNPDLVDLFETQLKKEDLTDSDPNPQLFKSPEENPSSDIKRKTKGLAVRIPQNNGLNKGTQSAHSKYFSIETEIFLNERKKSMEMREKMEKAKYFKNIEKLDTLNQCDSLQKTELSTTIKNETLFNKSPKAIQEKGAFIDRFREKILGGVLILVSFVFFVYFGVCMSLGLDRLGAMFPLSLIVSFVFAYVNWVSMKLFRHS